VCGCGSGVGPSRPGHLAGDSYPAAGPCQVLHPMMTAAGWPSPDVVACHMLLAAVGHGHKGTVCA
jgi:hypothetical protein